MKNKMNDIHLEAERSIIKTYRKELWKPFNKAIEDYQLISKGDKICVCISGGKDSMLLAKLFQELKRHSDYEFEVEYLVMNPGYSSLNLEVIKNNLKKLNIDAHIVNTEIFAIADHMDKEHPCYLCARMRRGSLYKCAKKLGCNKIALGHHFDDVIITTLMNMLNSGSFQTMLPKLKSTNNKGMELIRPMYLIHEEDVIRWQNHNNLSFIQCACRLTESIGNEEHQLESQRYQTKLLIQELKKVNPQIEYNIFKSAENVNVNMILGYKKGGKKYNYLDEFDTNKKD